MTDIQYEKEKNGISLTVMGHCNAGRINGMDLCCCAVSMLVFTLLDSLKKLRLADYKGSYGGGWCHVRFTKWSADYKKALTILEAIMNGFGLLQCKYPNNVQISIKGGEVTI